ncbi:MAG: VCBS repeat-containing protein, partial [Dehalococcoidia bacterium]
GATGGTTTQPTLAQSPLFLASQLDPALEGTAGANVVIAAQLNDDNGDGSIDGNDDVDLVSGSDENQPIQVHLNLGPGQGFETFSIAGGGPIARMVDLAVTDIDGDGLPDVAVLVNDTGFVPVTGASLRGAVVLLFAPADTRNALAWQEVTISATFVLPCDDTGLTEFTVADFDGTNGPDFAVASNEEDDAGGNPQKNIRLYSNPGGAQARNGGLWTESTITTDAVKVQTVSAADIDQDGDLDIVATFPSARTFNIRWQINPLAETVAAGGNGPAAVAAGNWARRILGQQGEVDPENVGGDFISVGDIDGDTYPDVAVAHAGLSVIRWFENPSSAANPARVTQQTFPWQVFNIGELQSGVIIDQLQLVDMDNNGSLDCFVTASGNMLGLQRGTNVFDIWFAFSIVATNPVADIGQAAVVDVDKDGLIDIVAPLDRPGLTQDQILLFTRLTP